MFKRLPKIGLLIESSRSYGRGVLQGIAKYAHANGPWSCYVQERELHSTIPHWMRSWDGDGIIARIEDRRIARELLKSKCPVVDVLGSLKFAGVPSFDTDANAVAKLAADFFLQAGFQHFAFCGYPGIPFSERRGAAFAQYLADRGKPVLLFNNRPTAIATSNIQAIEQSGMAAELEIARWLRKQPQPLALFACNDVRGQQVLNACRRKNIRVPEEVAVMGVDNDTVLCSLCEPPLSSIIPDTERLGYEAAALLDRMMRDRQPIAERVQIPPLGICERASTDILAIDDPITVQAMRFIRDHVCTGIAVKDVLVHVQRSRTDLEQRFRVALKSSVRREILRLRLDRVSSLLRETNLNLAEIAQRSGFSSAAHLCRLFIARYQKSPTEYRKG